MKKHLFLAGAGLMCGLTVKAAAPASELPCRWERLNLDGGGSSTMWTRHHGVVNHPSDNRKFDHAGERPVHNALYLISGR